jgi:uncharacterized protein YjiS (DUF1127 family)
MSELVFARGAASRQLRKLWAAALSAARIAFGRWRDRRACRELSRLDDRQLRDIGLDRGDLYRDDAVWRWGRRNTERALAGLDDEDARHLSEFGRRLRRESLERLRRRPTTGAH